LSATCSFCGKSVVWATDDKGTRQILDPSAPVFLVSPSAERCDRANGKGYSSIGPVGSIDLAPRQDRTHMVSHWSTCPKAADVKRDRGMKR